MNLELSTTVARNNEKYLTSDLGDEVVMMDLESGDYVGLNEVGGSIWKLIDEPISIGELIRRLMEDYEVSREECERDVLTYLQDMHDKNMVFTQ